MNLAQLNQQYAIPSQLEILAGSGGLPFIEVRNAAAKCRISLYGGQVLSYIPTGSRHDLLFLSKQAYFATGKAIKGGVPICWPWFGADPENRGRPAHGFARNSLWSVGKTEQIAPDRTRITLRLRDDAATRALWPHAFELLLVITVAEALELQLVTRNLGDHPLQITQALHTYFSVDDIARVRVEGLDGATYLDKVKDFAAARQSGAVTFDQEVDRIYRGVGDTLHVVDPAGSRTIEITAENSTTAVVWNPWRDIARNMADLGDDDYRCLVCVETANAADEIIDIDSGAEFTLGATYRLGAIA